VTELEAGTRRSSGFEYEENEEQGRPLHVQVSFILSKIGLLWAKRRLLIGWTLSAMIATLLLMFTVANEYQATAYLNPPDLNPMSGISLMIGMKSGVGAGLGSSMGDMLGLKSPGQIYIRQMQSRPVQDALIQRFHLQQVYKTKKLGDTRSALARNSEFSEDKKSGVIEIAVLDRDPNRAAQLANAYADELGHLTAGMTAESGRLEREYFESQLLQAKNDFRHASEELGNYGGQKGALDVEDEGKALAEAVSGIEGQLIATKTELKGLQQIYTDNNVQVQQANARIAELTSQLAQVSNGSQAKQKGDATTDSGQFTDPSIRRMWGLAPSYMSLYGNLKIQEAVVQTIAEQYELSKLQESHRVSDVQLMDPAQPPEKKFKPHRATMSAVVGFLVFGALSFWILAKDAWNRLDSEAPWKQMLQPAVTAFQFRNQRGNQSTGLASNSGTEQNETHI
jgi:capsule polysaccharide export protein KpsE/RkpR